MKIKVGFLGVFLALALVCSYVESCIPFSFGIPGVKLGLANIVIVFVLYRCSIKDAYILSFARACIAGFLFGNGFSILYSLAGAMLSLTIMVLLKQSKKFHVISISICGGIAHNIGQWIVAALVLEQIYILSYLPILFLAGLLTGLLIGILAQTLLKRIPRIGY